jgi:hypothetical protein
VYRLLKGGYVKTDIFLSGLVSGLTILFGVITADWLKRLRDRTEYTRRIVIDIWEGMSSYIDYLGAQLLESWGFSKGSRMSQDESDFVTSYAFLMKELRELSESPRWPQRNARRIREAALAFLVCVGANLNHCGTQQVLLAEENAEELMQLETDLRDASLSRRDARTIHRLISERQEEMKHQMLSREAANGG